MKTKNKIEKAWLPYAADVPIFNVKHTISYPKDEQGNALPTTKQQIDRCGNRSVITYVRRPLYARDMPVFLACLALVDRVIGNDYNVDANETRFVSVTFKLSDLLKMLGVARSNQSAVLESLQALAGANLQVVTGVKHKNYYSGSLCIFKSLAPESGKPRFVTFGISRDFLPANTAVWGNVGLCIDLKSDIARAIYWYMLFRESKTTDSRGWRKIVGSTTRRADWYKIKFAPALEELAANGYNIEQIQDEITIRRPSFYSAKSVIR